MINQKNYFSITSAIFLIIAVLHILRVILGWPAVIGGWEVPIWLSWVALILAGYLAFSGLKLKQK